MRRKRRLVAVSNRVGPVRNAAAAGGLAVGLVDALQEHGGWADEQTVLDWINKPDNTGIKLRAKDELWKKLGY